jgi:hypothetical protein
MEYNRMRELNVNEIEEVSGGGLSFNEAGTLILGLGAAGGPLTFAFAFPIAAALYWTSNP